jgi:hypothetical protein
MAINRSWLRQKARLRWGKRRVRHFAGWCSEVKEAAITAIVEFPFRAFLIKSGVTKQVVWGVMTAAMFAMAALLTVYVTSVNGRIPIVGRVNDETEQAQLDRNPLHHGFVFSVLMNTPSKDTYRGASLTFRKGENEDGGVEVRINVAAHTDAKVILNHLPSRQSCRDVSRSSAVETKGKDEPLQPTTYFGTFKVTSLSYAFEQNAMFMITPARSDANLTIACSLEDFSRSHTFVTRRLNVYYFNAEHDAHLHDYLSEENLGCEESADEPINYFSCVARVAGYEPIRFVLLDFSQIEGADRFSFNGGFQDNTISSYESRRLVAPETLLTVEYVDVVREQLRDILLIVIGTFIGIGCTMLIEGLRPSVEQLVPDKDTSMIQASESKAEV